MKYLTILYRCRVRECHRILYDSLGGKEKKADNDHFRIGKCAEADIWPMCTGGCNGMALGGMCKENEEKKCDEGNKIGFYVNCSGDYNQDRARERTCKGIITYDQLIQHKIGKNGHIL